MTATDMQRIKDPAATVRYFLCVNLIVKILFFKVGLEAPGSSEGGGYWERECFWVNGFVSGLVFMFQVLG